MGWLPPHVIRKIGSPERQESSSRNSMRIMLTIWRSILMMAGSRQRTRRKKVTKKNSRFLISMMKEKVMRNSRWSNKQEQEKRMMRCLISMISAMGMITCLLNLLPSRRRPREAVTLKLSRPGNTI